MQYKICYVKQCELTLLYKITSLPFKTVHLFTYSLNSSFIYFYLKLKT